nr:MAG TPA: hypothetical protein [Caudoviricetes sp.]
MLAKLNGKDLSGIISNSGFSISYKSRTVGTPRVSLGGLQYSNKTKTVVVIDILIDPLTEGEYQELLALVTEKYVTFEYHDPKLGDRSISAIPSDTSSTLVLENIDGVNYWSGISISLEER